MFKTEAGVGESPGFIAPVGFVTIPGNKPKICQSLAGKINDTYEV